MSPANFVSWLSGIVELNDSTPDEKQWLIIKDHLQEVFYKVTPDRTNKSEQKKCSTYTIQGPSTLFGGVNRGEEIFVTVTNNPQWAEGNYSFFPQVPELENTEQLLHSLGVKPKDKKIRIIVDNNLKPKYSYANNLSPGPSNHLVGPSDFGPGIVNVGLGEPLVC